MPISASRRVDAPVIERLGYGTMGRRLNEISQLGAYLFALRHPAACASTSEQNQRLLLPDILSAP